MKGWNCTISELAGGISAESCLLISGQRGVGQENTQHILTLTFFDVETHNMAKHFLFSLKAMQLLLLMSKLESYSSVCTINALLL